MKLTVKEDLVVPMRKFDSSLLQGAIDPQTKDIIISTILKTLNNNSHTEDAVKFLEMVERPNYLDKYISNHLSYVSWNNETTFSFGDFMTEIGFPQHGGWSNLIFVKYL